MTVVGIIERNAGALEEDHGDIAIDAGVDEILLVEVPCGSVADERLAVVPDHIYRQQRAFAK